MPSGEPAIMRRRNDITLKTAIIAGAALMLAPIFVFGQEKPGQEKPGQEKPGQEKSGQERSEQEKAGQTKSGQAKAEGQPDSGDAIFSAESRLVPLNVTVTDKSGRLITNLPKSAFQVLENG